MSEPRKRANTSHEASKPSPAALVKKFRVPLAIVLIWGAIVAYNVAAAEGIVGDPGGGCPGHWHAMNDVFIDGEELTFDPAVHREFHDNSGGGFHLHDDSGRFHFHPGNTERCIPLGDFYEFLGITVGDDSVTVSSNHNYLSEVAPGTYTTNETHELRVYEAPWDYGDEARGEFTRVKDVSKFMDKQVGNGHAVLVTYVAKDVADSVIQEQQGSIAYIGDEYVPSNDVDIFMPIVAATLFAGAGLLIWRKFTAGI